MENRAYACQAHTRYPIATVLSAMALKWRHCLHGCDDLFLFIVSKLALACCWIRQPYSGLFRRFAHR
ncbi:hypothetical protein ACFFUP_12275 [Vibrio ostreicida]|nr:hypothetical protein [Vibrio ostreicida]NPD09226.1 hypothetical protein [Vibrio ostreicida]